MNKNCQTKGMNSVSKKTDCRGYVNAIKDIANQLLRMIKSGNSVVPENCYTNNSLSYLITKNAKFEGIKTENIKYVRKYQFGLSYDSICRFDFRVDLDDVDIVLRVSNESAKLYIGGIYALTFNCPNGAYIYIMSEIYNLANNLGVAA